jgi:hypothetical protein
LFVAILAPRMKQHLSGVVRAKAKSGTKLVWAAPQEFES